MRIFGRQGPRDLAPTHSGGPPDAGAEDFRLDRVLFELGGGQSFALADAQAGVAVFGATGSGKTSGPGSLIARAYLKAGLGGLVLCAKPEERGQWEEWAEATGRSGDLAVVNAEGPGFNFLEWEAAQPGKAGFSVNVVALLDEIAGAIEAGGEDGGDGTAAFFRQQLRHLLTNLVDLLLLAGLPVSLPLMRLVASSAPLGMAQLDDPRWRDESDCWKILQGAEARLATPELEGRRRDFAEVRAYWMRDFPSLSDRTRSIVQSMFGVLIRPFVTSPLRQLFSETTDIRPEDAFAGKVIVCDMAAQDYRQIGRVFSMVWKWCFQVSVMRRQYSPNNHPVFLWADEAQNFITERDAEYQAVARSAGGCTVYLTQQREGIRRVLRSDDACENLLANLQCKVFCQNTGQTNEWASSLLGERYTTIKTRSVNLGRQHGPTMQPHDATGQAGMTRGEHEELRRWLEPAAFTTLKKGGVAYANHVQAIAYCGGKLFAPDKDDDDQTPKPYRLLNFRQRGA
jgi:TraM recognition site of TraD and TraG